MKKSANPYIYANQRYIKAGGNGSFRTGSSLIS